MTGRRMAGLLGLALSWVVAPSVAHAASYVKSVEYVPLTLTDAGATRLVVSANLTKGQVAANCVPFATASGTSLASGFGKAFADVYLTAGSPATVTVERTRSGGDLTVGVFVVEFDPTYVKVQQGTYTIATGSAVPVIQAITAVDTARAALAFYSRNNLNTGANGYNVVSVQGWFQTASELQFDRNTSGTPIDGHWYVFEALNVSGSYAFAVQSKTFTFAGATGSSTVFSPSVLSSRTLSVGSYQTAATSDHADEGALRLYLSGCGGSPSLCTTFTGQKYVGVSTTVTAFAVVFAGQAVVQRGTFNYTASGGGATLQTAALSPAVNLALSMAWNGLGNGPGSIAANEGSGDQMYMGQQRLSLPASATVQGNRDAASVTGIGTWEVIQWDSATPVTLAGFSARGFDSGVRLEWETVSELDNLGFRLYRALSAEGPWTRLNDALVPGLGSSPEGRLYSWTDAGLVNGTTYYYRLDDVSRDGATTQHGPVSSVPRAGVAGGGAADGGEPGGGGAESGRESGGPTLASSEQWTRHGDPERVSLRVLERSRGGMTLELVTGGFYSITQDDGSARLHIPGFFDRAEPGRPLVPTRRFWSDALVGYGTRVVAVRADDVAVFRHLRPPVAGRPIAFAAGDGTYRAGSLAAKPTPRAGRLFPEALARVQQTAFQGEDKKVYIELSPLRVSEATGHVALARRLVVRLAFQGRVAGEKGRLGRGRRPPRGASPTDPSPTPLARFATRTDGLHAVAFEEMSGLAGPAPAASLSLSRLGQPVAFHVEPQAGVFGPGSTLYFLAEGTGSAYAAEAVYELSRASGGLTMETGLSSRRTAATTPLSFLRHVASFEQDTAYLPALLEARDPWMWDWGLGSGHGQDYRFVLDAPLAAAENARLVVELQGGSDTPAEPDHHVRAFVNGSPVGEIRFDGMVPKSLELEVPPTLLRDGENTLRLENAGDTGASSFVYLDRFSLAYARPLSAVAGVLEGAAPSDGRADLHAPAGSVLLDATGALPRWLGRAVATGPLAWNAEAGHRYVAVFPEGVVHPEVRPVPATTLRHTGNHADWIAIAPQALLPALGPLLARRQAEGLSAIAVSLEDVVSAFGHGERSPLAVRDFLAFAFHRWAGPAPRYVLLLGDASYDPRGRLTRTSRPDLIPAPLTKSAFLWTASDPTYAAVNGEDSLPDLAIGRITAATPEEATAAVQKITDFEGSAQSLAGRAVLVADNPDAAGAFEANLEDIAGLLAARPVQKIYLTRYAAAAAAKADLLAAFGSGASLVSYVGHGSAGAWASEGLLRFPDVASLAPQPAQPLVLTLTCSSGYFLSPFWNSLSESLVLVPDRGAIASFSPSGLSLNEAAHVLHQALVSELELGGHERLGDLVLAAQVRYAASGAFPELLAIYHLFGDPALRIR